MDIHKFTVLAVEVLRGGGVSDRPSHVVKVYLGTGQGVSSSCALELDSRERVSLGFHDVLSLSGCLCPLSPAACLLIALPIAGSSVGLWAFEP